MTSYWKLSPPAKANSELGDPNEITLSSRNICVTFPNKAGSVSVSGAASDRRIITNKKGQLVAFRALEEISFDLRQGDKLAVVGRNGSGKTTLLQVLAGIISPDSGQVVSTGRRTSLININLGIQPEATGHRNITLRGLAAGYSIKAINEKRAEIAEFSELGDFLDFPIETYSAGMRMRLTFAIATAFNPEILILDEWLSAGDLGFKAKATARMQEFVDRAGILILASHSRALLLQNCNVGIWLDEGRIKAFGTAEEIVNKYEKSANST